MKQTVKKIRAIFHNTKESGAMGLSILRNQHTTTKEKTEAVILGLFGGIVWTWMTDGLKKKEANLRKRSE